MAMASLAPPLQTAMNRAIRAAAAIFRVFTLRLAAMLATVKRLVTDLAA